MVTASRPCCPSPCVVTFACGYTAPGWPGLAACAAMIAVGEAGGFNPFVIVIVFGPWLAAVLAGAPAGRPPQPPGRGPGTGIGIAAAGRRGGAAGTSAHRPGTARHRRPLRQRHGDSGVRRREADVYRRAGRLDGLCRTSPARPLRPNGRSPTWWRCSTAKPTPRSTAAVRGRVAQARRGSLGRGPRAVRFCNCPAIPMGSQPARRRSSTGSSKRA